MLLIFSKSETTLSTAQSIPLFSVVGLWPAATNLLPSLKIDCANIVAVVVPSPALSAVFDATSFTIWAPISSNGSINDTSLATVTPSFVICGEP